MSNIYNRKTIRVPVKLINGEWAYFDGGPLPIKEGTIGDLVIDKDSIADKEFLTSLQRKSVHKILDVGSELLVVLTIKPEPKLDEKLRSHLIRTSDSSVIIGSPYYFTLRSPDTQFVKICIHEPTERQKEIEGTEKGGVWLHLEGSQPKGISTSTVKLPDEVSEEPAISLNHAFTLLSEKYEPWRKSHTGNIYDRILYQEKNMKWYPLDILRNMVIAKDEHQLIKEKWTVISKELNNQPSANNK